MSWKDKNAFGRSEDIKLISNELKRTGNETTPLKVEMLKVEELRWTSNMKPIRLTKV